MDPDPPNTYQQPTMEGGAEAGVLRNAQRGQPLSGLEHARNLHPGFLAQRDQTRISLLDELADHVTHV